MTGSELVLESVTKRFGSFTAVDDLDLTVPEGSFFALLGPSGCGKTTLLNLVAGYLEPDKGEIYRDINVSWPIGFSGGILPDMTGREGTRFVARVYGADIYETEAFVEDFSELGRYFDMEVRTYSAGMRSRLGFAISMAMDFECYLVDEITLTDPKMYTEPIQITAQAVERPDLQVLEYTCTDTLWDEYLQERGLTLPDVDALAGAVIEMIELDDDTRRKMATAALAKADERSQEAVSAQWDTLLKELAAKRGR